MIRIITYRSRLDGKHGDTVADAIRAHVSRMVRVEKRIRGVKVVHDGEIIDVSLRMSGSDRWRIARDAKKIGSYLLASQRLPITRPLFPVAEFTEPNARSLTLETGRTPQLVTGGRPRKGTRASDVPAPGDWWGDSLPQ